MLLFPVQMARSENHSPSPVPLSKVLSSTPGFPGAPVAEESLSVGIFIGTNCFSQWILVLTLECWVMVPHGSILTPLRSQQLHSALKLSCMLLVKHARLAHRTVGIKLLWRFWLIWWQLAVEAESLIFQRSKASWAVLLDGLSRRFC